MSELRNLAEVNEERRAQAAEEQRRRDERDYPSGIACPGCGEEMKYEDPGVLVGDPNESASLAERLYCLGCGHRDLVVAEPSGAGPHFIGTE